MPNTEESKASIDHFKGVHLPKLPGTLVHKIQIELARREITWSEFAIRAFEKELKAAK